MHDTCYVCQRVPFGELTYLNGEVWRHRHCAPGSPEWIAYYRKLPKRQRTEAGNILYAHATREERP